MKKVSFLLLSILLVPMTVKAALAPSVKTLEASAVNNTINYNGTVEDGSHAVMCKLLDKDNKEVDLLSSAVDNGAFTGSFNNVAKGTYTVSCANYEGGEFKKAEVEVTVDNPKTGDNMMLYCSVLAVSVVGIAGLGVVLNKRRKKNN